MKKIICTALLCALTLALAFALASCGGPNSDEDNAVRNLNAAGYDVEAYETKLDGFEIDVVWAEKDEDEFIVIYYFDEKADAKTYFERYENELKENAKEFAPDGVEYKVDRDGELIYAGTEAAIKATKGK